MEHAKLREGNRRRRYPSDLSEDQWNKVVSLIPARQAKGRPQIYLTRDVVEAINYRWETGCPWRMLPHDYPDWRLVYFHFQRWRRQGVLNQIQTVLISARRRVSKKASAWPRRTDPRPMLNDRIEQDTMAMSEPAEEQTPFPEVGSLLCFDHGERRIGLAVSDVSQSYVLPLETYVSRKPAIDVAHFRRVIADYSVKGLIVGLPLFTSGDESPQSGRVRIFGESIQRELSLPVRYWDERYSTSEAETLLWAQGVSPTAGKDRLDALAAAIILQSYVASLPKK